MSFTDGEEPCSGIPVINWIKKLTILQLQRQSLTFLLSMVLEYWQRDHFYLYSLMRRLEFIRLWRGIVSYNARAAYVRLKLETTVQVVVTNRLFVRTACRICQNFHLMTPDRWFHRVDALRLANKRVLCTFPVTCARAITIRLSERHLITSGHDRSSS